MKNIEEVAAMVDKIIADDKILENKEKFCREHDITETQFNYLYATTVAKKK